MPVSKNFIQAHAIVIETSSGLRYFSGFGKSKRIQTAWSLAGAKLFMVDMPLMSHLVGHSLEVNEIAELLESKKKKFQIVTVKSEA
ncbi:hypothetical protein ONE56_16705 [Vibrio mytili]|uniref:hypothetical protein n=1 Tax=Vibrio mytili TaxID=50718 RepID=UPI003C7045F2